MDRVKRIFLFLLILLEVSSINSEAQNRWALRTSIGSASAINVVDGYYYSFDIGIPVTKWIEIAPTFNFFSTLPSNHIDISWNKDFPGILNSSEDLPEKQHYSGDVMGSVNLVFFIKPLASFDNSKFEKHELAFGAGFGLKSYATVRSGYEQIGNEYQLKEFGSESNLSVEPYFGKIFYNYHFTNQFFAGLVASLDGFDGEAVALFGIQMGVNFNTKK